MSDKVKSALLRYGITTAIGALLTLLVLDLHGYVNAATQLERYRILCDAFTIPGLLILMLGCMVWIAGTGALDGISYALKHLATMLLPFAHGKDERYYDYVSRKQEKRGKGSCVFLLLTGSGFLAVAGVFMVLFYSIF